MTAWNNLWWPYFLFQTFPLLSQIKGALSFFTMQFFWETITLLFLFGFLFSASVVSNSVIHSRGTSIQIKLFVNSTLQLSWFQRIFIRDPPVVFISLVVTSSWSLRRRRTFFQLQKFYHAQQGKHQASKLFVPRHWPSAIKGRTFHFCFINWLDCALRSGKVSFQLVRLLDSKCHLLAEK
jgi:hypothetical protein